jgi:hypothetical protein
MNLSELIGTFSVGALVGALALGGINGCLVESNWKATVTEKGYAYYHPQTAEFTWKDEPLDVPSP